MNLKKIDKDDVEEIFAWLSALIKARSCDNAVALEVEKILLEKFKNTVGFSQKDIDIIEKTAEKYRDGIAALKELKEKEIDKKDQRISLDERVKIFWEIVYRLQELKRAEV